MKYRSAKGKAIDWNGLASSAHVPAVQREIQRSTIETAKPAQRFRTGHVPSAPAEEVEVEAAKPTKKKKPVEEPVPENETDPTE